MKHAFQLIFILICWVSLKAQTPKAKTVSNNNGTVRGYIIDRSTGKGIKNAYVELLNYHPTVSTATDAKGYFELIQVPFGHQRIHVIADDYYEAVHTELVEAGKDALISIPLEEQFVMQVVEVEGSSSGEQLNRTRNTKQSTVDPLNTVSTRPINVEAVRKFVSGFNDPVRALTSYPGLYNVDDTQNYLISRSNSPQGIQQLIEGIPIESPNHFPLLGHTGGIFPLVNSNALGNSDFSNGAMAAHYGNAYAGVMDMNLRKGNNRRHEFMGQIGLFGVELMAEGPFKEASGSYLVVARGGIFSLLQAVNIDIGTNAIPQYYDLNFKIDFPTKRGGSWSVFGVGGYASVDLLSENVDSSDLFTVRNSNAYLRTYSALVGVRNLHYFDETASLKTTFSGVIQHYLEHIDTILTDRPVQNYDGVLQSDRYGIQSILNKKFSKKLLFRAGLQAYLHVYDIKKYRVLEHRNTVFVRENQLMGNLFGEIQYRFSKKFNIMLGVHAYYWNINARNWAVEPRFALNWNVHEHHRLSLGYGWHSKAQSADLLYAVEKQLDGSYTNVNRELGPTRSHHAVITYDWSISKFWAFKLNVYGQYNYDIAIERVPSSYAAMNYEEGLLELIKTNLTNGGEQFNYGAEASLERFFGKGFYGLLSASYQHSSYRASDNITRNSAYNVRFIGAILAGKEFKIGREKRNAIYGDARFSVHEGTPTTPIDIDASRQAGATVLMDDQAFSRRFNWYNRLDVRLGMRFNHPTRRISHHIYLEVLNIAGARNDLARVYLAKQDRIITAKQFGFFPNFLYQIRF